MMEISRWKVWLVACVTLLGVLFALPNFLPPSVRAGLPGFLPSQTLNLGLDLQGGSYLLLEVDTDDMFVQKKTNLLEDVRARLREAGIEFSSLTIKGDTVVVQINQAGQYDAAYKLLAPLAVPVGAAVADLELKRTDNQGLSLGLTKPGMAASGKAAVDSAIETVRRRIDALGTKEPSIMRQGLNRIVVQAPGESNPENLKRVIGRTAKLTFQMVDDTVTTQEAVAGRIPPGAELLPYEEGGGSILVKKRVVVSGENLKKANVGTDQNHRPAIEFMFDGAGAKKFGIATSQNIGKQFAIILDGKVMSAPRINSAITGGSGIIEGNFTYASAAELVAVLNSGALPAKINVEEQRTVGAELGADSVAKGTLSTIIGFIVIVVFMVLAYGFLFGGVSVIALLINLLLILAGMTMFQATLTLPGVAGLILSLAVAVDANVLIYERIRDEERSGHKPLAAMSVGFSRALVSILDANITSLISALIMFQFGAGPVRGFAWTLMLGVFTSVFTAVLVSQVLLGWWYKTFRPKSLPI
jgi:protein-export membrane protein SecD